MPRTFPCGLWAALALLITAPASLRSETVEPTGEASLAWRLDSLSTGLLGPDRPAAAFKLSAALLRGAEKLTPNEPRFPRLQVLALMQAGDRQGAIDALIRYRKLQPADPVAQVELVDLYTAQQETLDDKVKYLSETAENQKLQLAPEVRAQLATEAAMLLAQKSPELAGQMATKAVQFYPLPKAAELYYRFVAGQQQLPERIAALLTVLKGNPGQVSYLSDLATVLADNGLANESLQWYELIVSVVRDSRMPSPPGFHNLLVDYCSEVAISGKIQLADTIAGEMINEQPLDADAWFLKLTCARVQSDETFKATLDLGRTAFVRRWNRMHGEILSGHPSTEPVALQAPESPDHTPDKIQPLDPAPIIEKVQKPGNEAMKAAAISVASDIAWFELYFDHNAEAAQKWIDVLRMLLPADSTPLRRLLGWQALIAGRLSDARDILSKVAKDDTLSEFGLITADRMEKKPADPSRIQKLLDDNRVGLVAVMLWTEFKNPSVRPKPRPNTAAIQAQLKTFPDPLLNVLDPRQASRVYTIQAEPLQITYDYGTPVLARVTIANISQVDLTFGPDALVHPDLWFDAQTLGINGQVFSGIAFDRLQGAIVLRPHNEVSQIVRLDEGKLRHLLHNSPDAPATTVNCDVMTNPIPLVDRTTGQEIAIPGPGGMATNFFRTFTYAGIPLSTPAGQKALQDAITSGSAVQKIHAADLIAAYIQAARKPGADEGQRKLAASLPAHLQKLRSDTIPLVSAWAGYVSSSLATTPEEAEKIAGEMSTSTDWTTRLLSVLAGGARPAALRRQVASRLANDADPIVKSAANAMADWINQNPSQATVATQPATVPSKP